MDTSRPKVPAGGLADYLKKVKLDRPGAHGLRTGDRRSDIKRPRSHDSTDERADRPQGHVLVANFERVYPNIPVDVTYNGSFTGLSQLEVTELAAGSAPDVLTTFPGCGTLMSVCVLARAGDLAPMVNKPWAKRPLPIVTSLSKKPPSWQRSTSPNRRPHEKRRPAVNVGRPFARSTKSPRKRGNAPPDSRSRQ